MSHKPLKAFPTWSFDKHCHSMEWNHLVDTKLVTGSGTLSDSDLVVIAIFVEDECEQELKGWAHIVDQGLKGVLQELLFENSKAIAKLGSVTPTLRTIGSGGAKSKRYAILSLGKAGADLTGGAGLLIGKAIASVCRSEKKVISASIHLPDSIAANAVIMRDLSTSFYQELYSDNRYRTGDSVQTVAEDLKEVRILTEGGFVGQTPLDQGKLIAKGVILCKDIVNAPHNVLNSESLAETAKRIADESGGCIKFTVLGKKECEARGMGAYLGVGRGSETEPQFIHLTYRPPNGKISKKVGIVGKGLLFDTGEYNIKTGMMELMKFDCGGAAAVFGAARAIGELQPADVEAHFIVAACENMISDKAIVPSDIVTASNGKTIEIMNTDAEGRLTLADALVYAEKEVGCEKIVELSTLTGACMVALGKEICGIFTDDDALAAELSDISKVTGDKSWRMPMVKEYREQLKSKFADLQNIGTPYGGSITAALFLQNFVDEKIPFAHIDIVGPVWCDKTGATGFGTKMIIEWVTRQGKRTT